MPSTGLLTTDDLDEIGCSSFDDDEARGVVAKLIDAVEQGRVADQTDTAYALLLAAEITERKPGFVRRPDLIVVPDAAVARVRHDGGVLRACEVLVIVEIVSPGSHRTDHVIKRGEYADAGIPHYWIVDFDDPVTLIDCHLAGEFGYQDAGPVTSRFTTTEPFPLSVRLDDLIPG